MPTALADRITKLCDDWCIASVGPDGANIMSEETEKHRLLANGIYFYQLNHAELCTAIIGLSKVLLRPRLCTVISNDHAILWAWCGELVLHRRSRLYTGHLAEIHSLYSVAVNAALAALPPQPNIPNSSQQLISNSGLVLAYLSLPLLEAVIKNACLAYISYDGKVKTAFSVPKQQGGTKKYVPYGEKGWSECSSLRDLLFLHRNIVASPRLQSNIDSFMSHIQSLDPTQHPFDLIYSWRNQSLHGTTNYQTIGGSLLNLALLISISELETRYDNYKLRILESCGQDMKYPPRHPSFFYPPH